MNDHVYEVTVTVRLKHPDGIEGALAFVRSLMDEQGMPVVAWNAKNATLKARRPGRDGR